MACRIVTTLKMVIMQRNILHRKSQVYRGFDYRSSALNETLSKLIIYCVLSKTQSCVCYTGWRLITAVVYLLAAPRVITAHPLAHVIISLSCYFCDCEVYIVMMMMMMIVDLYSALRKAPLLRYVSRCIVKRNVFSAGRKDPMLSDGSWWVVTVQIPRPLSAHWISTDLAVHTSHRCLAPTETQE